MKKVIIFLLLIPFSNFSQDAQKAPEEPRKKKPTPQSFTSNKSPYPPEISKIYNSNLYYKGEFKIGFSWFDVLGKNTLILSGKKPHSDYLDKEDRYGPIEMFESGYIVEDVYAYHYVGDELIWKLRDFSDTFIWVDEVVISDLDNDGISETWIGYSSEQIKVIMHEGNKKYAIRGHTQAPSHGEGCCDFIYDLYGKNSFQGTPEVFKEQAIDSWKQIANIHSVD